MEQHRSLRPPRLLPLLLLLPGLWAELPWECGLLPGECGLLPGERGLLPLRGLRLVGLRLLPVLLPPPLPPLLGLKFQLPPELLPA